MTHLKIKGEDVHTWPIGSSIIVKFPHDEGASSLNACAAMIAVTPELKEVIEQAARSLVKNNALRTVQFYWPFEVITNEIYQSPIPKQFSQAILEILSSNFEQAIADETAQSAIRRMSNLEAITWVSVERPLFGIGGGAVRIGCTIMGFIDFSTVVKAITASTRVPDYEPEEDNGRKLERAVDDLCELALQIKHESP